MQGNLTLRGKRKRRNTGPQSQAPNLDILSSALDDKTPTIGSFPETRRFLARSDVYQHIPTILSPCSAAGRPDRAQTHAPRSTVDKVCLLVGCV